MVFEERVTIGISEAIANHEVVFAATADHNSANAQVSSTVFFNSLASVKGLFHSNEDERVGILMPIRPLAGYLSQLPIVFWPTKDFTSLGPVLVRDVSLQPSTYG